MGLATLMSRILGLCREQVFAYLFGASHAMDAFNIAFRIPNLLRDLFAEGAMSAAFVPNFTRALLESRAAAFRLLAGVLAVLVVGVTALSAAGIALSPSLVEIYASSYHAVPGKFELAVGLTRAMFPFFPLVALAAVVMGALNAMGFFFLPSFAPAVFNMVSILSGITLCPLLERLGSVPPIYGMAVGVVAGGFFQFYVQWWQIRRQGFRIREVASAIAAPIRVPGVKKVLWLLVPGTVGLASTQLGILINSIYATGAGAGAVSWLNYAFRLMQFPIGIFGVSLAAAALPVVSRALARGDGPEAGREVNRALRMTFAVNGPAAAGLMAAGLPIVQLLFEHGRFGGFDSRQTAAAVFWYALGLPGYSVVKVLVPVFYALGTTRAPVATSFVMVGLNAMLNHVFLVRMGMPFWSLAAATATTVTLNAVLLAAFLRPRLPGAIDRGLLASAAAHGALSAAIGAVSALSIRVIDRATPALVALLGYHAGSWLSWGAQVGGAMAAALLLWWGAGTRLGIPENRKAAELIANRISPKLKKLRPNR